MRALLVLLAALVFGSASPAAAQLTFPAPVQTVNSVLPDGTGNVTVPLPQFVANFTPAAAGTVANLLANAPCNASRLAQYAVVSDLYSTATNTNEVLRCGLTGSSYYWRPQRTDYAFDATVTGGSMTLTCLTSAPQQFLNGTLLANMSVNLATTNCWPGARFEVANNTVLGLFGLNITGLIGSTTRALGLNGRGTFIYNGTAWQAF